MSSTIANPPGGLPGTPPWVANFGRDFDLNTGPWVLELVSGDIGKDAQRQFSQRPAG